MPEKRKRLLEILKELKENTRSIQDSDEHAGAVQDLWKMVDMLVWALSDSIEYPRS